MEPILFQTLPRLQTWRALLGLVAQSPEPCSRVFLMMRLMRTCVKENNLRKKAGRVSCIGSTWWLLLPVKSEPPLGSHFSQHIKLSPLALSSFSSCSLSPLSRALLRTKNPSLSLELFSGQRIPLSQTLLRTKNSSLCRALLRTKNSCPYHETAHCQLQDCPLQGRPHQRVRTRTHRICSCFPPQLMKTMQKGSWFSCWRRATKALFYEWLVMEGSLHISEVHISHPSIQAQEAFPYLAYAVYTVKYVMWRWTG